MDRSATPLIRTLTLPAQANLNGGIFGGWILGELDKAAGLLGMEVSRGACATIAVESAVFASALRVGEDFRVYGVVEKIGNTSMRLRLEGWVAETKSGPARKVVDAVFVSVALDDDQRPRPIKTTD